MPRSFRCSCRDHRIRGVRSALVSALGLLAALTLAACHSANIIATVSNRTPNTISLIQVEYPSASFGIQSIGPGQEFKYRLKVLGSGQMKITFTDISQVEHKSVGPTLNEGSEGTIAVIVTGPDVAWQPAITTK